MARIFGVLNVTRDSFSDGGSFLDREAALAQGKELLRDGADVIDVGAESTHPDAEAVEPSEQLRRLGPVVQGLVDAGAAVSVDAWRPEVMEAVLPLGVRWLNCVRGFRADGALDVVAAAPAEVGFVVMFARGAGARASRPEADSDGVIAEARAFFGERITAFEARGIDRARLVLDPGMGFFLGKAAAPSLHVLRHLESLLGLGAPLMISVSRKSVIGEVTGRPVSQRAAGTLAAELWAARQGVQWIRTHDVRALRDGLAIEQAIENAR